MSCIRMLHVYRMHAMQRFLRTTIQSRTKNKPQFIACMQRIALTSTADVLNCPGIRSYNSLSGYLPTKMLTWLTFHPMKDLPPSRAKTKKSKKKSEEIEPESESEEEPDSEAELEEEEEEEEEESDVDEDAPDVYRDMVIYTLRADSVAAKGLNFPKSKTEQLFYSSKLLLNGKTLLKKGSKLAAGDIIDVVMAQADKNDKILVKRVKVHKVKGQSAKGKDVVQIRAWRDPFEIDTPEGYVHHEDSSETKE